ncbi:MAG TPA: folate-binding protein [Hyphomicrobiales bacterium]|nr:folate-binding protein [Hyphomicrobiales bacterium]
MTQGNIARLPDRGIVEVEGPDAASFLHNLVTNDIAGLGVKQAAYAGLLTPKGKIVFDFLVYRRGGESFLLDCAKSVAGDLAKRFALYKLRAKITVTDHGDELTVGASWGEHADWPISESLETYDDPRYSALGKRFIASAAFWDQHPEAADASAAHAYHQHRIALGIPEGGRDFEFGEAFPHDACFEALNGVDYKKGCYIGQEVVSRMHHKGTAKTGVAIVEAETDLPEGSGAIYAGDSPAGQLGSVAGTRGIAIVRMDRIQQAQTAGQPISVDDQEITVTTPAWLTGEDSA